MVKPDVSSTFSVASPSNDRTTAECNRSGHKDDQGSQERGKTRTSTPYTIKKAMVHSRCASRRFGKHIYFVCCDTTSDEVRGYCKRDSESDGGRVWCTQYSTLVTYGEHKVLTMQEVRNHARALACRHATSAVDAPLASPVPSGHAYKACVWNTQLF